MTTDPPAARPRRGRPPLPATEAKILAATRQILADGGVRSLTMEGVAALAGVAKTTVYRRYRSRDDLALAVLIDMVRTVAAGPEVADVRAELVQILRATLDVLRATLMGRVMQGLAPELAVDVRLSEAFREQVVALRIEEVGAGSRAVPNAGSCGPTWTSAWCTSCSSARSTTGCCCPASRRGVVRRPDRRRRPARPGRPASALSGSGRQAPSSGAQETTTSRKRRAAGPR